MACELHLNKTAQDFPGGPVVRTPGFHTEREQVQSLVGELGSYMPCGKKTENKLINTESKLVVSREQRGEKLGKIDKGDYQIQTFSYKINVIEI